MHAHELVELAALVAAHGSVLVRQAGRLSPTSIEEYWTASRCRLDRWNRSLKGFSDDLRSADADRRTAPWPFIRRVVEEILAGEVLTRVWTAVLCACDGERGTEVAGPVARSIMTGHLEARRRVLTLLIEGDRIDSGTTLELNRLRRRAERWSDLLIGYLLGIHDVSEFAIDPARARDFAEDLRYRSSLKGGRHAWPLILASLRAAFQTDLCAGTPNADLNHRIAGSILACFQPELFDSTGVFHSLWLMRLTNTTNDAEGLVEELLAM